MYQSSHPLLHKKSCRRRYHDKFCHFHSLRQLEKCSTYLSLIIILIYITGFSHFCQALFFTEHQMFSSKTQKHCPFQTVLHYNSLSFQSLVSLKEKLQNSDILQKSARPDTGSSDILHSWRYPKILSCRDTPGTKEAQAMRTQTGTNPR